MNLIECIDSNAERNPDKIPLSMMKIQLLHMTPANEMKDKLREEV